MTIVLISCRSSQQVGSYKVNGDTQVSTWNFCKEDIPADEMCNADDYRAHFAVKIMSNWKCYGYKDPDSKAVTESVETYDENANPNGISLTYTSGKNDCPADTSKSMVLKVNLTCDEDRTNALQSYPVDSSNINQPDQCTIELNFKHKTGCPSVSVSKFIAFMMKYQYIWGAVAIVLGIFLAFFGNKFVNVMLYIIGTLVCFLAASALFFKLFLHKTAKVWVQWLMIAIIFVFSNLFGYICVKFRKWGLALIAGWGGVMLGLAITTAFFVASEVARWCIWVGLAIVCFLVTLYAEKKAIMILTSFIGSYSLIRGISFYAGGFPNEFDLAQ